MYKAKQSILIRSKINSIKIPFFWILLEKTKNKPLVNSRLFYSKKITLTPTMSKYLKIKKDNSY